MADGNTTLDDWGKLILRLAVGGLMLFHGVAKVQHGIDGPGSITEMVVAQGLPAELAWGVYVGEIVAPLLIVVGFLTRSAGLVLAFNMGVAVYLAHRADLFTVTEHGAWALELQGFYFFGALAVACLGAGKLSLRPWGRL